MAPVKPSLIYQVAVPSPLRRLFDYLPPAGDNSTTGEIPSTPGCRVIIPFGKREVTGIIVKVVESSDQPVNKLKPIIAVLDSEPIIPPQLLQLYLWASDYYQHPVGDALASILPTLLRQGASLQARTSEYWRLTSHGLGLPPTALSGAKKQQQLLQLLMTDTNLTASAIAAQGISREIVRTLQKKGLIESFHQVAPEQGAPATEAALLAETALKLRPEQQRVMDSLSLDSFNCYLLQGETGSGKTEIYLQAIAKILLAGKQALVLIPEINLTPQTLGRFQRRFHCEIAVLHSGLNDRQRLAAWQAARSGRARILIGTRSAVFTPLKDAGIIIIDEEHDSSYKQQEGFRYAARDVAVMRASREGIPVILGSATPSLESLYNCERGRYQRLILNERPEGVSKPRWQLLDIRQSRLSAGFSSPLIEAIGHTLKAGNQVLVFLNRRGYAPLMLCHDCGWMAQCTRCSARMTVHRGQNRLLCHHCEFQQPLPDRCPDCHSHALTFVGQGTERGEDTLRELFPATPVVRIDRDTTRRKDAMQNLLAKIDSGEPCLLVGTQMLAKGHHFPHVTLAALLDVDGGLFSADFRATEKMGQLITQVAGRAGRAQKPGTVLTQSHLCDHPLITQLTGEGYNAFASTLLDQRRLAGLPPCNHLALLRAEAETAADAEHFLRLVRQRAEQLAPPSPALRYLGPLPAPMERRNNRFRFQLAVFADQRAPLQQLLTALCPSLESEKSARKVRWSVDVDPQEML